MQQQKDRSWIAKTLAVITGIASGILFVTACGTTTSGVSRANGSPSATAYTPKAADLSAITDTYNRTLGLTDPCRAVVKPGSYRFAQDSSGVRWALASFIPVSSCVEYRGGVSPPVTLPQWRINPFTADQAQGVAVSLPETFKKPVGQDWIAVAPSGNPFPCPPPHGQAPGAGNGAFPKVVLDAWGLSYAANCASVLFPSNLTQH